MNKSDFTTLAVVLGILSLHGFSMPGTSPGEMSAGFTLAGLMPYLTAIGTAVTGVLAIMKNGSIKTTDVINTLPDHEKIQKLLDQLKLFGVKIPEQIEIPGVPKDLGDQYAKLKKMLDEVMGVKSIVDAVKGKGAPTQVDGKLTYPDGSTQEYSYGPSLFHVGPVVAKVVA